jgi:hypothetical protein
MMIIRFRIEAKGSSREMVVEQMLSAVGAACKAIQPVNGGNGRWVCSDEVISQEKKQGSSEPTGNYNGRMVMRYEQDAP